MFPRITTSVCRRPVASWPLAAVSTEKPIDVTVSATGQDVLGTVHEGGQRETLSFGHDVLVYTLPAKAPVPRALAHDTRGPAFAHARYVVRPKDPLHPNEVACFPSKDLRPECMHGVKSVAIVQCWDPACGSLDASEDGAARNNNLAGSGVVVHQDQIAVGMVSPVLRSFLHVVLI